MCQDEIQMCHSTHTAHQVDIERLLFLIPYLALEGHFRYK